MNADLHCYITPAHANRVTKSENKNESQNINKPLGRVAEMARIKDSVKAKMKYKYSLHKSSMQQNKQRLEDVKSSFFYKNAKSKSPTATKVS